MLQNLLMVKNCNVFKFGEFGSQEIDNPLLIQRPENSVLISPFAKTTARTLKSMIFTPILGRIKKRT